MNVEEFFQDIVNEKEEKKTEKSIFESIKIEVDILHSENVLLLLVLHYRRASYDNATLSRSNRRV